MRKNITQFILFICIAVMMIVLLLFPSICIAGATEGLLLWFHKLLPSLLPFMILMNLLCSMGIFFTLSHRLSFLTQRCFHLSGPTFMLFLLGLIGGYPMGAKLAKQLLDAKQITYAEASKSLCFCSNCGPLFIIGTVGTIMLGNTSLGYFLLAVHVLSALVMLLLSRFYSPKNQTHIIHLPCGTSSISPSEAFTKAVQNAMDTIVYVGGYIIFFSVIIHLFKASSLFHELLAQLSELFTLSPKLLEALILGSLEFSNGAYLVASLAPPTLVTLALLSVLLAFGGFCVFFQCSYVLQGSSLPLSTYFISKCLQAVIAFCLTFILAPFFTTTSSLILSSTLAPIIIFVLMCFSTALLFKKIA